MSATEAFREERRGRIWLMYAPAYAATIEALGLREPEAARSLLAIEHTEATSADRAIGRSPGRLLHASGQATTLHFRRALHGGLLAPLWREGIAGVARVRRQLQTTACLRGLGAPVPEAAFALAYQRGALWEAGLATVFEPDALDGVAFLARSPDASSLVHAAGAVGRAIRVFHDKGGRHPDLHIGNILVRQRRCETDALVIDLDGVELSTRPTKRRRRQELQRLERSLRKRDLIDSVSAEARAAFCLAYAGEGASDSSAIAG